MPAQRPTNRYRDSMQFRHTKTFGFELPQRFPRDSFLSWITIIPKIYFCTKHSGPCTARVELLPKVKQRLYVEDQFFMLLIKPRQHKTNFELSHIFRVTESTVTNVFATWINLIYFELKEVDAISRSKRLKIIIFMQKYTSSKFSY